MVQPPATDIVLFSHKGLRYSKAMASGAASRAALYARGFTDWCAHLRSVASFLAFILHSHFGVRLVELELWPHVANQLHRQVFPSECLV